MPGLKEVACNGLLTLGETQDKPIVRGVLRQPASGPGVFVALLQATSLGGRKIDGKARLVLRITGTGRKLIRQPLAVDRNPVLIGLLLHRVGAVRARDREGDALGLGRIHHGARGPRGLCPQLLPLEIHEVVRLPIYLGEGAHLIHQATQRLGR